MDEVFEKLIPSDILQEDIEQEAQLLILEGKVPHRGIIRKQMVHNTPNLHFAGWLPRVAEGLATAPTPISVRDYDKLISYLYSLENVSEQIVTEFLDNPEDEDCLAQLLDALYIGKHLKKKDWASSKPKEKSIRVLIFELLQKHTSLTIEQLFKYVSGLVVSKRPASITRQAIKLLIQSGDIKEIENGRYAVTN